MPTPRKPTKILDLTGRLKHDPKRYASRKNEPVDDRPLGGPPGKMDEVEQRIWREVADELVPGVAVRGDRRAFGTLVKLLAKEERNDLMAADRSQLVTLYTRFGMTPSDRSRVSAPPKKKASDNPFTQLG